MLAGNAIILKKMIKEKRWDDLIVEHSLRPDTHRELISLCPKLFQTSAMKTNSDGTLSEQVYIDYPRWSIYSVVEKLKENRRALNL